MLELCADNLDISAGVSTKVNRYSMSPLSRKLLTRSSNVIDPQLFLETSCKGNSLLIFHVLISRHF